MHEGEGVIRPMAVTFLGRCGREWIVIHILSSLNQSSSIPRDTPTLTPVNIVFGRLQHYGRLEELASRLYGLQ